jgi:hypothetical protein
MSPLAKTLVPLDFTQGVDTKTDEKLGAKPTTLENGVFGVQKSITRRPGYDLVDSLAGFGLGTDALLASLGSEFVAQDKTATYGVSTTFNALKNTGRSSRFVVSKRRVVRRNTTQSDVVHASVSGLVLYAWNDYDGTTTSLKYCIFEEATGVYLTPETTVSTTARKPRAVAFSDRLAIFYCDGVNLKMLYVTVASPTTSTTVTIQTNVVNTLAAGLDAAYISSNNTAAVCYQATADFRVFICNSSGTVTVAAVVVSATMLGLATDARIGVFTGGNILVLFSSAVTSKKAVYSGSLAVVSAAANTGGSSGDLLGLVQDAPNQFTVFDGTISAGTAMGVINSSGTMTTSFASFLKYAVLAADPFVVSGRVFIPMLSIITNAQPTGFLVELASGLPKIVGAFCRATAGSLNLQPAPCRTRTTTTGAWPVFLLGEKGKLAFQDTNDVTPTGVSEFMIQPDVAGFDVERYRLAPVEYGGSLYFPGPQLMQFDGVATYEAGFHLYPEAANAITTTGATGLTDGAYQYCFVYEFVDAQGQLHRSAPSIPQTLTVTGGPKSASVPIRTLLMTDKPVNIVVYRTKVNGSTFYRVNPVTSPIANITTAASITYTDTATDATIGAQGILYTAGELENVAPPASIYAHVHQRRLVLVQAENRRRLSISDELEDGYGPTFNEATEYDCGASEHGDVVGVASLDDKLVLLRERALEFVAGDGPDRQGLQNTWTAPQFITSDTGCVSAASIVQTPDGVMFKGERGIYLLNRGLQLAWVGEEVESLTGRIADAVLVPKKTQVRFSCPEASRVLAYDYAAGQWSVFTGLQFDSMVVQGGSFYGLTRAGALWSEGDTTAGDNATAFSLKVVTPWIKAAGVRGVQRIYRALLLGAIKGFSTLTLEIGYDFASTYDTTVTVNTASLGAVNDALSVRKHLDKQKCEAVRFRITCDGQNNGVATLGISLSNMTLEVGGKRGAKKLPAGQTI